MTTPSISISIGTVNGAQGISFSSGATSGFLSFADIINFDPSVKTEVDSFSSASGIPLKTLVGDLISALDKAGDQSIGTNLFRDIFPAYYYRTGPHSGGGGYTYLGGYGDDDGDDARKAAHSSSSNRAEVAPSPHDRGAHAAGRLPDHALTAHADAVSGHSADHAAAPSALDLALTGRSADHAALSGLPAAPAEDNALRLVSLHLAQTLASHLASAEPGTVSTSQAEQHADWHLTTPHS